MEQVNPVETPPVKVKFGPGQDDSVPLSWAVIMLTHLRETNPGQFGKLIIKAAGVSR